MSTASQITRKAKSNLAFALNILPRERRQDMVVFYAFCRTMDDLADDAGVPKDERARSLDLWEQGLVQGFQDPDDFQKELVSLVARHEIPTDLLVAIIDGCRSDLQPQRFQTWDELSAYVWKVACAVGLVSIRIFGCTDPGSERYAVALGHALQLTNILRDIEEDLSNGLRIYLPMDDLTRFDYSEQDLIARVRDERFLALMDHQAERAEAFYREATESLPPADRNALLPARIMQEIYHLLLGKIREDRFQVFEKRYRISKPRKLVILSKHLLTRNSEPG